MTLHDYIKGPRFDDMRVNPWLPWDGLLWAFNGLVRPRQVLFRLLPLFKDCDAP